MKTPEECLDMLAEAYRCPDVAMTETIAVIQLDAWRQGMTDAAKIVEERQHLLFKNNCKDTVREHYSLQDILAARDAKGMK